MVYLKANIQESLIFEHLRSLLDLKKHCETVLSQSGGRIWYGEVSKQISRTHLGSSNVYIEN